MMSTRKRCDLYFLCSYANVILLFYFASAYTDPLDGKSLEDLYGLLNQPTMLNGWMATGRDPCGQNWTGVSCSYSSTISRKISELGLGGTMSSQLSSFHSLTQLDSCRDRVANVVLLFYFASAYTDPLDVKSLEDLYGLLNQPTKLTGWMATGGYPCGQNWTDVSCSCSSIISRKISRLGGTMSSQLSSFHSLTQLDSCRDRVANVILLFYFASAYTDPLDVKSLEDLYGLLNQPTMLNGWMATGGDPCGQNWTGVSCSYSSIISRCMNEICSPRIAYGNIKTGNVLFDEEFVPFSMLSHILPTTSMDFKMFGGSGYTAPEMSIPGSEMIKGHIFSFGVLLQELSAAALAMILTVYLNLRQPSSRSVGLLPAFIGALFVLPILQVAAVNPTARDGETLLAIYVGFAGLIGIAAAIMAIPLPESKGWTKTAGKIMTRILDVGMLILLIVTTVWGCCIYHRNHRVSTRVEMKTVICGFFTVFVCLGICIVLKVLALTLLDFSDD